MVSRNQVSFVTGLHSYLIQPVSKIHFIALAPQAPQMGGCNRAKGIVPQLEPLHGFCLLSFGVVSREGVSNMLHKSFSARVVFIPQAPMQTAYGCFATGCGPLGDVVVRPEPALHRSTLRASYVASQRPRPLGVRFSAGTGLLPRQSA